MTFLIAQSLVEYSAVTAIADTVDRISLVVQDWTGHIDSRILIAGGLLLAVWLGRRMFSHRY